MSGLQNQTGNVRPVAPPGKRTSEKAIFAFLLGISGLALWFFAAFPAIILGAMARGEIRRNAQLKGRGLATMGLFLGCIGMFFAPIAVVALFSMGGSAFTSAYDAGDDRIVHLHLSGAFAESYQPSPYGFFGGVPSSFHDLMAWFEEMEDDDTVQALVVTVDMFQPQAAHLEEIHHALRNLIDSGKDVYVHSEEALMSNSMYVLLSAGSHFNAVPTSMIDLVGLYSEGLYLKAGLESIGIQADIVHIGDYKSAGDMMMRDGPSDEAAEAMNWLLDGMYESRVNMIAHSRDMTSDEVRAAIDGGPYTSEQAEAAGLIDSRMYQDEFTEFMKDKYGEDIYFDNHYGGNGGSNSSMGFSNTWFSGMGGGGSYSSGTIGLVVLEGTIYPGYGQGGAFSGTIRYALDLAAQDDSVEVIVLRVNSPGGSVTASEVILRAVQTAQLEKPVIVSMGSVAASGGYYVACQADSIFADELTVTGSIGVVGGKIVTAGLWDELGISWHATQRGANADWGRGSDVFTDVQRAQIVESMGAAYATFKDHVEKGRGEKLTKDLEEMAGGRVFTGKQALALGLIDEIGGLTDALEYAAELVELDDYDVRLIPRQLDFGEMLQQELFGTGDPSRPTDLALDEPADSEPLAESIRGAMQPTDASMASALLTKFDPDRSRELLRFIEFATLIKEQGVVVITPQLPVIR
ncbi:MAG: S49 family peptidase [Candidatus Hydrogenedentota bacterium]